MNKKGLHWEQMATGILTILVVILIIGIIYYFLVGDLSLPGFLKSTKEKVVAPLEDIDFSRLTASERERVIEEAVSRDAEAALESARKAMEQGDYEKAKQISDKISDNVEGKEVLVDEVNSKIKIDNYVADEVSNLINQKKCFDILRQDVSEAGDMDDTRVLKLLLKHYYTVKCYSNSGQIDRVEINIDLMTRRYSNHEITKRTVKEFSNQKT